MRFIWTVNNDEMIGMVFFYIGALDHPRRIPNQQEFQVNVRGCGRTAEDKGLARLRVKG